jgi:hypothetical protein
LLIFLIIAEIADGFRIRTESTHLENEGNVGKFSKFSAVSVRVSDRYLGDCFFAANCYGFKVIYWKRGAVRFSCADPHLTFDTSLASAVLGFVSRLSWLDAHPCRLNRNVRMRNCSAGQR